MPALLDLTGSRFGKLTVTGRGPNNHLRHVCWWVRCDCGNRRLVDAGALRSGNTQSCGCSRAAGTTLTHGHGRRGAKSPTYLSWFAMKQRCGNPNHPRYADWGGRGVTVCERWLKFENFLADMGERPSGRTLDRIDNDGNYEPGNCRWATPLQQRHNRRSHT